MKKIKLSISDDSGNINFEFGESPLWRHSRKLSWVEIEEKLGLTDDLTYRLRDWKNEAERLNDLPWEKEDRVRCEIEGLAILLELRKELPDYQITYSSNFNSFHCVLNEEQEDKED